MVRSLLCSLVIFTGTSAFAVGQPLDPSDPIAPSAPPVSENTQRLPAGESTDTSAARGTVPITGNPAAVNIVAGTGKLGEILFGLQDESALRLGGLWIGDASWLASGGRQPGLWSLNSLAVVDLSVDAEKWGGPKGGMFGTQFLQYTGQPTNGPAGVVQGYDSLNVVPPFTRQELYQLWWRQSLLDNKLIVRVGKMVPTYDFNNVLRPSPTSDPEATIPAVSGLIFTPAFVNPTILGKIPGYYNSASGITITGTPTDRTYISYGIYDGNLAAGEQTGLRGPQFNGYYFNIGETGVYWELGSQKKPGMSAVGVWGQTGQLNAFNGAVVDGAQGFYTFGSQRLWFRHHGIDNSGISGFWQFGANNTNTSFARQYYGGGLTAFGLIPQRASDSMGFGMAWSILNGDPGAGVPFSDDPDNPQPLRDNELILQWYYQMNVTHGVFFQPTVTYVPNPGQQPDIPAALAVTLRLTILF